MTLVLVGACLVLAVVAALLARELRRGGHAPASQVHAVVDHDVDPDVTKVGKLSSRTTVEDEPEEDTDEPPLTVYESDSQIGIDEPTGPIELILVSAAGQTDRGRRRRRNEDCYLVSEENALYVIADGMGGYAGGEIASKLAIDVVAKAFSSKQFVGKPNPERPRRGNELVWAIEAANGAVFAEAKAKPTYAGMGTTLIGAWFSPRKQRVYIGHVGDSRCYRWRDQRLVQLTADHTLGAKGVTGPYAAYLSRALGIAKQVKVDLIVDAPRVGDQYLLCSDGLSKMVSDGVIQASIGGSRNVAGSVRQLVRLANENGGADNVTIIMVAVQNAI